MSDVNKEDFYSGEEFQLYFEKSSQSLILKANSPDFLVLAVSNRYLQLTHIQKNDILGRNLFNVFPGSVADPSEQHSVASSFQRVIESKNADALPVFKYEIFMPSSGKSETQYWSNLNEPVLDRAGNVAYIINTTANVTEQVLGQAESERVQNLLKANEQNIQNMVRQAPVGMCILQGDPLFAVEINDYFLTLVGKEREKFKLRPYWEVIPEAATIYEPITSQVMQTGITYQAKEREIMLVRGGKEEFVYVDFVYEPMQNEAGIVFAIMIVATDVTDKVRARKELQSAYEQVRLSKEAAELGTFDMDMEKGTMQWDVRCRELFGITHQGPVTYEKDFYTGLHFDDRTRVLKLIDDLFNQRLPGGDYDVEYRTVGAEDARLRWVRAKGKVFFNTQDEAVRFIGSVLDITEQKQDEQRKNDFIGMVSHELKTPLTSVKGYLQVLQGKIKSPDDGFVQRVLFRAMQQVNNMGSMINGFLNISRLESGKIYLEKSQFDIEELVGEAIAEATILFPKRQINLIPCKPVLVNGDRDKIHSVIGNFLSNADKYSPQGKTIEVECEEKQGSVQVSVKDEGMGVQEHDKEKLFERFYRVEREGLGHISGFGIGLYLSAEIIERHEGKIWVESEFGKGSTFFFTLPLTDRITQNNLPDRLSTK